MIRFAHTLSLVLLLGACAHKDAFEYFSTDPEYEKAALNLRSARITENNRSTAIISAIYLNRVYPEYDEEFEYFLVSFYARDRSALMFPDANATEPGYRLTLNGTMPSKGSVLKEGDTLLDLMPISNRWNDYYLLIYPEQVSERLILRLENDRSQTAWLRFQKDE